MSEPRGIEFVRDVAALHTRPLFMVRILSLDIGVQAQALEAFIRTGELLPAEAMVKLVDVLFHSRARWNEEAQRLGDVKKPPQPMGVSSQPYAPGP
jgi:hypothetical protein